MNTSVNDYIRSLTTEQMISLRLKYNKRVDRRSVEECWPWQGAISVAGGYGRIRLGGTRQHPKMAYAHRLALLFANGDLEDQRMACHRCDNPRCVNPNHLYFGTQAENVQDMDARGRRVNKQPKGSQHGLSRLTENEVRQIRLLTASGATAKALSEKFKISLVQTYHIRSGRVWKHVIV